MAHGYDGSADPSTSRRSGSLWIVSPWWDPVLFVATPVLILPGAFAAMSRWSVEEIALFVFAFGQLGHNLPGMLRAYGDRALFQLHKIRFIAAPVGLLLVSSAFIHWNLSGLILVSAMWGIWHALMQTYGMLRIYDAKSKSFAKWTQRLDLAMCLCWFSLAVLVSRGRLALLLDLFFRSGGSPATASIIGPVTAVGTVATIVVSILYLIHLGRSWRHGSPPNPVKLLLLVMSIGFYWYTSVTISNILLGLAMFEVFHDVQYLAIVWIYNRNRVENGSDVGGFTRFLFRRSGALVGLYVGMVFAYGSLYYLEEMTASGRMKDGLTALLATSALLHYYYDGFIWKLREKSTRKSLRLEGHVSQRPASSAIPPWLKHATKWAAFGVPVCWLFVAELSGIAPEIQRLEAVRDAVPSSTAVHLDLGVAYQLDGNLDAAAAEYRTAIRLDPKCTDAYNNLGLLLISQDEMDAGIAYYQQSLQIDSTKVETHNNLGKAFADAGDFSRAQSCFRRALQLDPDYVVVRNNLALILAQVGNYEDAERHFRRAIQISPRDSSTHFNFGNLLAHQKKFESAAYHYRTALEIDPENNSARWQLKLMKRRASGVQVPQG